MSRIRPIEAADIPAIAALFQRVLRKKSSPAPDTLADYMRRFYLEAPGCDEGIASLVHLDDAGRISGFVGVHAMPMTFNGRKLRAAICGSLMVEDRDNDPMAGARLLKSFLDGPQDLSFSETANDVATQLWTRLRGVVLPQYSLDWVRVIRPLGFTLGVATGRVGIAQMLSPLANVIDGLWRRRVRPGAGSWAAVSAGRSGQKALRVVEIGSAEFAGLFEPLTDQFALRPDWEQSRLDWILADAMLKPDLGDLVFASITSPSGALVGAFAYYAKPGRIGRVLQVLARPGQAGHAIDCLVDHAAARGLCGLRGRTQAALMEAMLRRRIVFVPVASTVVHSRDTELLRAMTASQAFLNGVAGEQWSRLIGGRFD
ncbi:hypothetical protein ASD64_08145 [Mesorhizobium sp. Root157]|uniref:hypothetical protein n=1 Tax=Mesorhizobium sp. Root157 TaxID=1736477 RepID=UPI0006F7B902|nr:hypothetical protein [Mesorhizobium sp. Root157]KQZ82896.1 hypothetical protein ASD64_08145 [Mesorhizobium sp. Root157]